MKNDLEKIKYVLEYDKGTKRTYVRATQWLTWKNMMKGELFFNYVKSRWGDCRVVGDNAKDFLSSSWNPENYNFYNVKYVPGEEPELLKMDDKKKFYYPRSTQESTENPQEAAVNISQILSNLAKRGRPRKDQGVAVADKD
jgi:hypothetical protein